ncbi:hypothetical protein [Methylorubrum zatmanii]
MERADGPDEEVTGRARLARAPGRDRRRFHRPFLLPRGSRQSPDQNAERLRVPQRTLYSDGRRALLIVHQDIDAAGRDGTCWGVVNAVNPQGVRVHGFKQPTAIENGHNFLWRVHAQAPARGQNAVRRSGDRVGARKRVTTRA